MTVQPAPGQTIKTHLFEILDAQGIGQRWLARQLGVSDSYLSYLKLGRRNWTPEIMARASEIVRIPQHVLFFAVAEQSCEEIAHDRSEGKESA